jgi:hypothetical protein
MITGLCIPEVRASSDEYVEHISFDTRKACAGGDDDLFDRVFCVVNTFLLSSVTARCREVEQTKYSQKKRQAVWRVLRECKRRRPYHLPDICQVVAEVARQEPPPPSVVASLASLSSRDAKDLIHRSTVSITGAIRQIYRMGFRKICQGVKFSCVVIGMLYMTRSGLNVGTLFNLPAVLHIHALLPSETYLTLLGVSNKVICDTENEIKSCIRVFSDNRVAACAPCPLRLAYASSEQSQPLTRSS